MPSSPAFFARPRIAVLNAPGAGPWPGLEPISAEAEIVHAHSAKELAEALVGAEILVVTDIRAEAIESAWPAATSLRWIHATSAGVDRIAFEALAKSDVVVTNARGVFDHAIAETVLGSVMAFAKDLRTTFELQAQRTWRHRETETIRGQQMLVVGAGSIGRQIARYARGVGLRVSGVARTCREDDPDFERVAGAGELAALLPAADWVVIAAPLTRETRHLFDGDMLGRTKRGARLINVGRGAIVCTRALVGALKRGQLAGAALDVFEEEPLPADHPLWGMNNVIITSHMAGDFAGWRPALSGQFIELFRAYRRGEALPSRVDIRSLLA